MTSVAAALRAAAFATALAGAWVAAAPKPAEAAARYAFSGTVALGQTFGDVFGLPDGTDLTGQSFSGTLSIGGFLAHSSGAPDFDAEDLEFASAVFTVTLNGVTETVAGEFDPLLPHFLGVLNGVNPRFGLPFGLDAMELFVGPPDSTGFLELTLASGDDILPGGAPGSLFTAASNGQTALGFLRLGGLAGLFGDNNAFELEASDFAVSLTFVPAPGAAALLGAGLLGLGLAPRRRVLPAAVA